MIKKMRKIWAISLLIFLTGLKIPASEISDTILVRDDNSAERAERDLDSLISNWYVRLALKNVPYEDTDSVIPELPDSFYEERLRTINSVIHLPFNEIIRNHIHVYTERKPEVLPAVLGLADYYFPMIEDIFDSYGLPAELKYMAVIESALNPNAVSRMGATGMWQFMYSTGRMYGLTINSIVDERRDPVKATHAAAKYLKDMYDIFHDWILVIAAYNCGPGNVDKAIRRSGNRKDYWEIYYRLPRETRGYIPQYIAATYVLNNYKYHNIQPLPSNIPLSTDTVMVNQNIHLAQISEVLEIPYGEIRALNPQYRTGLVPGSTLPQPLTLPMGSLGDFIELSDSISKYKAEVYLVKASTSVNPTRSTYIPPDIKGKTKLYYTVKEGDNLGYIAEWYRIGLSNLRYWNDIYSNTIRIGQKLAVFVDPSEADYYSKVTNMTFAQKQAMIGKPVPTSNTASGSTSDQDPDYIVYTVGYGDTIWDIVKKFENVTTTEVLALNNIADPAKIQVGQKIRIKKKN